jgi:putative transposase
VVKTIEKVKPAVIAATIRCCPRSITNWYDKWLIGGFAALSERSRRPKDVHHLEREKIEKMMEIRDMQGWGCSKIAYDIGCSSSTVHKYLVIHDKNVPSGKRGRFRSFERKHSNSLWQMDYTRLRNDVWVLQVVDDHSRFIVGARVMWTPNTLDTIQLLEECFSNYGVPEQFLTDHGTQFYSVKGGESTFDKFCLENMVDHILSSIAHPQTLGKTEQRHNMMKNYLDKEIEDPEFAPRELFRETVDRWVHRHNFDSPHEAWITYRIGDWVKKKRIHFLPFLRFANHRK